MVNDTKANFEEVKTRLNEIVDEVAAEDISLDNALDLYEEALKLGMQVSSLLEKDIAAAEVQAAVERMDADAAEQAQSETSHSSTPVDQSAVPESAFSEDAPSVLVEGDSHE